MQINYDRPMIWNSVSFPTCEKRNPRISVAIQQDPRFTASTQVSESWCWARAAQEFGEGGGGAPWENSRGLWSATSLIRKERSFKTVGKGKSTLLLYRTQNYIILVVSCGGTNLTNQSLFWIVWTGFWIYDVYDTRTSPRATSEIVAGSPLLSSLRN